MTIDKLAKLEFLGILEKVKNTIPQRKILFLAIGICFFLPILIAPSSAMRNPAAVYCTALGYNYTIEKTPLGDTGYCILQNGEKVEEWQFLEGKRGTSYSYCSKQGYQIKTIKDPDRCLVFMTSECSVCVFPNGTEIEVTKMMNLSFNDSYCGDKTCSIPENYNTCPGDCPSGSVDDYCDRIVDKICDTDCQHGEDPDCNIYQNETAVITPFAFTTPHQTPTSDGPPPFIVVVVMGIMGVLAGRGRR